MKKQPKAGKEKAVFSRDGNRPIIFLAWNFYLDKNGTAILESVLKEDLMTS